MIVASANDSDAFHCLSKAICAKTRVTSSMVSEGAPAEMELRGIDKVELRGAGALPGGPIIDKFDRGVGSLMGWKLSMSLPISAEDRMFRGERAIGCGAKAPTSILPGRLVITSERGSIFEGWKGVVPGARPDSVLPNAKSVGWKGNGIGPEEKGLNILGLLGRLPMSVSYTHLTLPTIYSV